jgi:hypothetical protein
MSYFKAFIDLIVQDLHLGKISSDLKDSLEEKVARLIDRRIEDALMSTLRDNDLEFYRHYVKYHPEAQKQQAFEAMIDHRPEIQDSIEDALVESYEEVMQASQAVSSRSFSDN